VASQNGIDFAAALAAMKNSQIGNVAKPAVTGGDKPKAQLWLNVGYHVPVVTTQADGTQVQENRFVSLPVGIAVDTMQMLSETSQNQNFAAFQQARNELLKLLIAAGAGLAEGEDRPIALELQLRRVSAPQAVVPSNVNQFIKPLVL
jgi:hypothetical protein